MPDLAPISNAPLDFDRPAYLGLDRAPDWRAFVVEGLERYGTHFAGSRLAPYCPGVYEEAEAALAAWTGAPAALTMSSASLAAITVLDVLSAEGYQALAGPLAHAAWLRQPVISDDSDAAWQIHTRELLSAGESVALVTDRVCAIRCVEVELAWLLNLERPAGRLVLVIDDSHALGALRTGRGSYAEYRTRLPAWIEVVTVASLGKAFSVPGAVICASTTRIAALHDTSGYGGASPLPPGYAHALVQSFARSRSATSLIERRITALNGSVAELERCDIPGAHVTGHPVFRIDDPALRERLERAGIHLSVLRYPTHRSPAVARVVLSASAPSEELCALCDPNSYRA